MYHPWDDDKGARSRIDGVVVVRGGLLPAGNDETDGLLRPLRRKEFSPAEGERKRPAGKRGQALSRPEDP